MNKKFIRFLMSCLLIIFTASGAWAVVYGQGGYESQGYSESTAWEINSAAVLAKVRDDVNSGKLNYECYFKLTKDIDLTGTAYRKWSPIGGTQTSIYDNPLWTTHFQGHFNGNGHTIKINISEVLTDRKKICNGLFGTILGGSVKNLNVSGNIEVYLRASQELYVGGIVAYLVAGSIENCKFDGTVTAATQETTSYKTCAGGIVGYAGWSYHIFSIKNCKVGSQSDTIIKATVSRGKPYAGGIVGYLDDNTYNGKSSEVSGNYSRVNLDGGNSGGTYGGRGRGNGIVENNTEVDPNEEPEPEPDPLEMAGTFKATTVKASYSGTATVTGGKATYKWTKSGTAAEWLTFSKTTGAKVTLKGTPTEAGTYTLKLKVTDANKKTLTKSFTIKVTAPSISGTFKGATLSTNYSGSATVTGGKAPYTWSKSGVPTGMTYKASGTKVTLSGKPTKKGTYSFKITATDANKAKVSKTFKITVAAKPTISGTFNGATLNTSYSGSAKVTGGTAPYTWTKSGVPTGMTYKASGATVTLSGKPTKTGSYNFKVTAKDANGASISKTFKITVAAKPTLKGTFNAGTVGTSYSGTATVTGGTAPYTWTQSGKPAGLTFKASGTKATLSGKPTTAKSYTFKATVTDANGAKVTKSFTIKISEAKSTLKFSGTFPEGTENEAYNATIKVSGGTSPYTWKKSGTLPDGLKISKNSSGTTIKLSGTPTDDGSFTFKLTATDSKGATLTKSFTVVIADDEFDDDDDDFVDFSPRPSKEGETKNYEPAVTELKILSEDILWQGEGRNEDLFEVKANSPVRFIIGEWKHANGAKEEIFAEDVEIFIDDKLVEGITVSDEGEFTVPAEFVHDDFKVCAKAKELETIELFIGAIE